MADNVLKTCDLIKRFGTLTAVDNLSLEVQEGEVFGFLGPNGAGKTTSLLMMCGLLAPDSGEVLIHGQPIQGETGELRAKVGVCPQETTVWEKLTCLEQLEFIGEMYGIDRGKARRRGADLLEILGLVEKRDQIAERLSGGIRRRLNLALALVHDPQILVLDEPEAGLDPQSRVLVREFIRSLARSKTVILTTHNMDEADRLADRVAIIDYGRLLVVDTPEALKQSLGEEQVMEIGVPPEESTRALQIATPILPGAKLSGDTLLLRGADLMEALPEILRSLHTARIEVQVIHMRSSTLEDVFISLTGRSLRE